MLVACGPESNGTHLLESILKTSGEEVIHRSLPYGDDEWWNYTDFPEGTRFVAIFRDPEIAARSTFRRKFVKDYREGINEQFLARARILQIPNLILISYERLIADRERTAKVLSEMLGLDVSIPVEIRDENAKYQTVVI